MSYRASNGTYPNDAAGQVAQSFCKSICNRIEAKREARAALPAFLLPASLTNSTAYRNLMYSSAHILAFTRASASRTV